MALGTALAFPGSFLGTTGRRQEVTMLESLRFAGGDAGATETRAATGRFEPGAPDWAYLPVEVPAGVAELTVSYRYDQPARPHGLAGNALDIGAFDPRGHQLGGSGFRGWSGSAREGFSIGRGTATPGYLPGPVHPGTWHLLLGPYSVAPAGLAWTVEVTLRYGPPAAAFAPRPAPAMAAGRGLDWYRGDAHLHTVHSDGRREPAELAEAARAAGLDFIVSTEHNTSSASGVWGAHAGPDLLIIDGEEVTTRNGHLLALGLPAGRWVDWRYRAADGALDRFAGQIRDAGGLAVAAHPFCPYLGCAWRFGYAAVDAVEVWNGPWTLDDEAALATWDALLAERSAGGNWLPAIGGSDAHAERDAVGLPRNVVLAGDLERTAILQGMRAGRLWIAESGEVDLWFRASSGDAAEAGIGERLAVGPDAEVSVRLEVRGGDGCVARLCTDLGTWVHLPLDEDPATITWTTTPAASAYVRAEVRRPGPAPTAVGAMVALTNPIWLGAGEASPARGERGAGR
jgi:hypothetical protein